MATDGVGVYEVVYRGVSHWRILINGLDGGVGFAGKDACVAVASACAREQHIRTSQTTEVWVPAFSGHRECIVRYMTPSAFSQLLSRSADHLREAGRACYLMLAPIRLMAPPQAMA